VSSQRLPKVCYNYYERVSCAARVSIYHCWVHYGIRYMYTNYTVCIPYLFITKIKIVLEISSYLIINFSTFLIFFLFFFSFNFHRVNILHVYTIHVLTPYKHINNKHIWSGKYETLRYVPAESVHCLRYLYNGRCMQTNKIKATNYGHFLTGRAMRAIRFIAQ
jgi:hypothetical protein